MYVYDGERRQEAGLDRGHGWAGSERENISSIH